MSNEEYDNKQAAIRECIITHIKQASPSELLEVAESLREYVDEYNEATSSTLYAKLSQQFPHDYPPQ